MKLLPAIVAGITVVAAAVNAFQWWAGPGIRSLPTDRIAYPDAKASGIVLLLSGTEGWSDREQTVSDALAADGAVVVGVDLPDYFAALAKEEDCTCLYLVSDIEGLSRQIHREQEIAAYLPPVIAGIGGGGALALAIAAQTPASTIAETIAIDPLASIPVEKILCTPAPKTVVEGGVAYGLTPGPLPEPVRILLTPQADPAGEAHADALKQTHPAIEITAWDETAETLLLQTVSTTLARLRQSSSPLGLPIVPTSVVPLHDTLAIIYSGDGGWRDIDQKLAAYLVEDGIPVVGVDALRYFWTEKSPQETATDLSRIITTYRQRWNVKNVVLIGYSFGANILPATYRLLPERDKQTVSFLSLLALSHQADFEIAVTGWLGWAGAAKQGDPVDDLAEIEPHKIQCIYGTEEEDTACPAVEDIPGALIHSRPGGHHFDGEYRALNRLIVDRIKALSSSAM